MNRKRICAAASLGFLCAVLTGCGLWDLAFKAKPHKGRVVVSTPLKRSSDSIEISRLPEEGAGARGGIEKNEEYEKIYSDEDVRQLSAGVVAVGDCAYEQYNYVEDVAVKYAKAVNSIAGKLKNTSDVYCMVAPTSIGVTLPDNKLDEVSSSDQQKALRRINSKLSDNVKAVLTYDALMRHRSEYVYFRTDHHWTALGAYYAYAAFCGAKGIVPNERSAYKKASFGDFLGSFCGGSADDLKGLKKDEMEVFYPVGNDSLALEYTNSDGETFKGRVIEDADGYDVGLKYCAFIDSDNPYTVIKNRALSDGSSCIVVKESFGNALVPFLADHYQRMYVVDYRYYGGSIIDLARQKAADDVILVNNISMTRNSYQVGKLALLAED